MYDPLLTALSRLPRHSRNVGDPYVKGKWLKLKKELQEEFDAVKEISTELKHFKQNGASPSPNPRLHSPALVRLTPTPAAPCQT